MGEGGQEPFLKRAAKAPDPGSGVETRRPVATDENREIDRGLSRAGIMYPVSGFIGGPESNFRFTDEGWARRFEILGDATEVV